MVLPDVQPYIGRFTSNNFNCSLLVVPSFANGGNLFVLPIILQNDCIETESYRIISGIN